jgi:hypothetical protein
VGLELLKGLGLLRQIYNFHAVTLVAQTILYVLCVEFHLCLPVVIKVYQILFEDVCAHNFTLFPGVEAVAIVSVWVQEGEIVIHSNNPVLIIVVVVVVVYLYECVG